MTDDERQRIARAALAEFTRKGEVGEFVSQTDDGEGVTTLAFQATMSGYPGWHWAVSVAEVDGDAPTVLEAELLPGEGALLAPDWVPWSERLEEYRATQAALAADAEDDVDENDDDDDLDDESDEDDDDEEAEDFDDEDESDDDDFDDDVDDDDDDDDTDDASVAAADPMGVDEAE